MPSTLGLFLQVLQCHHHQDGGRQEWLHGNMAGRHPGLSQLHLHVCWSLSGRETWTEETHAGQSRRYGSLHAYHNDVILLTQIFLITVERSGSGVELQTLDYENPDSNPVLWC